MQQEERYLILITPEQLRAVVREEVLAAYQKKEPETQTSTSRSFSNVEEAAAFLSIAKQTLYGLVSQRKIPFYKKSKRLYFKKDDLEQWILDGKKKAF